MKEIGTSILLNDITGITGPNCSSLYTLISSLAGYKTAGKTKLLVTSPPLRFKTFAPFFLASSIRSVIYLGLSGSGKGVSNVFSQGKPSFRSSIFLQNCFKNFSLIFS